MSAGMPELGSKISLISKADIRYEGRLFTVDPQECTIALANVRSFGTEDRETSYPIMPQPTVYDYILFRGSDIKDIRVVNNVNIPNDPAIMQMHLPPQQNFAPQNFPPMQQQQQPGQFGPFGGMSGPTMGSNLPSQPQQQQQAQSPVQQQGNNNTLAPGSGQKNKRSNSRSGTPQNLSRKSPTSDMGVQTNQGQRETQSGNVSNKDKPQRNNQRNNNQQQRERRDSGRNEGQLENKSGYRNQNQRQNNNQQLNNHQQRGGYSNNRDNREGNRNDNRNGGGNENRSNNNQMRGTNQGGSARMRGPPHVNNYRLQNNQGAPLPNKPNNNSTGPQQQRTGGGANKLKFENEFDFEQANSKFEELRSQLAKLKVGTEEPKPTEQVNGEVEKKDDSGNETGADHEAEIDESGYDKNKSFFDNISCEAVERSKGKTQRTDWRQERKLNSETFGYSSHRRINYRGRGGYYQNQYNRGPRQSGGGYRGGNPNYRQVRTNRNQNNSEGRTNNNQQSQNQAAPVAAT